jgi:hypothetical protein
MARVGLAMNDIVEISLGADSKHDNKVSPVDFLRWRWRASKAAGG